MKNLLVVVCIEFNDKYFIMIWLKPKTLAIDSLSDDMVRFLVKTWVCKRNRVTGHHLENPVNSSMKCTEATLFEITLPWNPPYCKRKKEYSTLGRWEWEKKCPPPPVPSLSACLLLLVSSTPFFGIYLEYERIEATPGLTDTVLLY